MAKKVNPENVIDSEIAKVEEKLCEFQRYLKDNNVAGMASVGGDISLSEEDQDKIHKEIAMQIKMMDSVLNWLPLIKKLRETEQSKELEIRGDAKIGGLFKKQQD